MSERMSSLGGEVYHAYERRPDPNRHPGHEMGEWAKEIGTAIRLSYQNAVHLALRDELNYTKEFRERVLSQDLDMPSIEVLDDAKAIRNQLREWGFSVSADQVLNDEALLVIRLPDPMNRPYQYKATAEKDQKQWKRLYYETLEAIYETAGQSSFQDIEIYRLNPISVHDPEIHVGYYYLWLIAPKGREAPRIAYPDDYVEPERKSYAEDEDEDGENEGIHASEAA